MKTEFEKMISGELYDPNVEELRVWSTRCRGELMKFNTGQIGLGELTSMFGACGEGVMIVPSFHCDYGGQIRLGNRVYMNAGCVLLDCAPIEIGDDVLLAPGVQLLTATHPLDFETRRSGLEYAKPIRIGTGAWLGGGVIVLPGVTIGARSVIGAGSVVTKDVPEDVIVAGNPGRILRMNSR
ncbi:sugar O-acetyltransferase [Lacunimicrobium album]